MLRTFCKKIVELFAYGGNVTVAPNAISASAQLVRLQTNSKLVWQFKKKIVAVSLALIGFNAYGAVTINIAQAGANVVVTANGSIKLPSASAFTLSGTSTSATSLVNASAGQGIAVIISNLNSQPMATFATSCSAGSGVNGLAKFVASGVVTASPIVVNEASPRYFNLGYTGGINIPIATRDANGIAGVADTTINVISRMTISNKTLAQMGIVDGQSATCTWGGNSIDESIIIQTNGTPSQPTVSSITPNNGTTVGGTSVTISGANFVGTTGISFGGTAATSWVVNNAYTGITINTPAHAAGAADVVVTTVGGTATLTGGYTFVTPALPTITSLATTSGPAAGGTSVVITGTNFTGATAVSFGGTAATSYTVNSATQITATTAAHAAGAADVVVTTGNGTATSAGAYTYVAAPTITSLATTSGTTAGGTSVVITGTNFTGASAVSFGGTAATSYTVNSATQITATTAAHAAGAADVVVTTVGGSATSAGAYTYIVPVTPTITSLATTSGATAGGTSVVITGTGFTGATAVTFGGTNASSYTVDSATQITATTPAHTAGAVSVLVTTANGTNAANTLFTYGTPAPTVTSLSPNSGTTAGGTSVTITGTNFTGATGVTIGGTAATGVTVVSATSITATTPAGTSGTASVVVTTPAGSNAANTLYTYTAPAPTVSAISPSRGTKSGGTRVTITGANFTGATGVTIGGVAAVGVTVVSATTITATTPAGTAGTASVVVTTPAGSNAANTLFTYTNRKAISEAATDASVLAIHTAQIMQSQKFVTTQIDNIANHLSSYRNNFNLRPSSYGFGVNFQMPSLGPASQALHKIKDELAPRPETQAQNKAQSKDKQSGIKKVGYVEEQDLVPYNDYLREEELAAEKIKQEQAELEKLQQYASNSQYDRENLTYSVWTAGTIDYANYKSGTNNDTQNKLTANGLTMGIDYKLHDAAIVGAAVGLGTAWQNANALNTNLKAKQTAVTGYGMFGFADHWVVEGLMGYGSVDFSGTRTTSDGAASLGVNRTGETFFSSATISKMYWTEGYKVTPFARQDVMHINLHSYAETGAADYALGFDSTHFMHTTTSGGLQVSRDIYLDGAKLTPTAKFALNRIRTGGLAQNIYYADTGAADGVYTLNQSGSYMNTKSLSLGLVYTTRAGDGFEIGWQGAFGANQYKLNGLRFALRFAM